MGRITAILVSLLTAFAMGMIYAFSEQARNAIGIGNVAIYLLTGFFMQYLVMASRSGTPMKMLAMLQWDAFEYVSHYSISITQYIGGIYCALFLIDFTVTLPFLIGLTVLVVKTISFVALLSYLGFILLSAVCLYSVSMLFSAFYSLSKNFRGYLGVLGNIIQFVCGVYFPVHGYLSLFGKIGGWIGIGLVSIFPHTYVFDLSRYVIFLGEYQTIYPLWVEFLLLIVSSIALYVVAIRVFKVGLKRLRKKGFKSYIY